MNTFSTFIKNLYEQVPKLSMPASLDKMRDEGLQFFLDNGVPGLKHKKWGHFSMDKKLENDYQFLFEKQEIEEDSEDFSCSVEDLNTELHLFINGWYDNPDYQLKKWDNGVIVGSLKAAIQEYPELVMEYLGKQTPNKDSFVALNMAFFTDGFFLYVPENVTVDRTFQLISLVGNKQCTMIQSRHLIILEKNSNVSLIQCDDTMYAGKNLIDGVSEIFVKEGASFQYYKMENKDAQSFLLSHTYIQQQKSSKVNTHSVVFNGGYIRNEIDVQLIGEEAEVRMDGLYLADRDQFVDNHIFVHHAVPNCKSYQVYKGIADDQAGTNFNSYVLVDKDAQKTEAHQSNKNIMLNDEANISTHPFLEINADDVKCSHGATIGQLDADALYYLRSRGIGQRNARMLLMVAFANEVADKIPIEPLRNRVSHMIRKRLSGERHCCEFCTKCRK